MAKDIWWHLPGFVYLRSVNLSLIELMREYHNCFVDGYKIGSCILYVYIVYHNAVYPDAGHKPCIVSGPVIYQNVILFEEEGLA